MDEPRTNRMEEHISLKDQHLILTDSQCLPTDNDPVMLKAIEMLRQADPKTQRVAALKLLLALEKNSFSEE